MANGLYNAVYSSTTSISFSGLSDAAADVTHSTILAATTLSKNIKDVLFHYAAEGTRSRYCGFLGVGYSITSCTVLSFPTGVLNVAYVSSLSAVWVLTSQFGLLRFIEQVGLLILFLGIIMRTFLITRGIGNTLIAVFVGLAIVYPFMIIAYDAIFAELKNRLNSTNYPLTQMSNMPGVSVSTFSYLNDFSAFNSMRFYGCPSTNPDVYPNLQTISKFANITVYEPIIFQIYLHYMLSSAICLLVSLGSISAIGKMLGQEIDVFRIERIS